MHFPVLSFNFTSCDHEYIFFNLYFVNTVNKSAKLFTNMSIIVVRSHLIFKFVKIVKICNEIVCKSIHKLLCILRVTAGLEVLRKIVKVIEIISRQRKSEHSEKKFCDLIALNRWTKGWGKVRLSDCVERKKGSTYCRIFT